MLEPVRAPREGPGGGEFIVATVNTVGVNGVTLTLPGQSAATLKEYKRLASASVEPGDRVLCVRLSGTIVVLGRIV